MARRSLDWNEGLAEDLKDAEFAQEFLLGAMDDGVAIQVALGKVLRAMGVKEFAAKVDMAVVWLGCEPKFRQLEPDRPLAANNRGLNRKRAVASAERVAAELDGVITATTEATRAAVQRRPR